MEQPKQPSNYKTFLQKINLSLQKEYDGGKELSQVLPVAEFSDFEAQNAQLKVLEYNKIIAMRESWSNLFKGVVGIILVFEVILTILVGIGILKFNDEWFLRLIIIGGFAQILTMPYTITKFLFSSNSLNNKTN